MVYTKQQRRSRRGRTKFGGGRSKSKREEERQNIRNANKEMNKQVKDKPKTPSFLKRVMRSFGRGR